MGPLDGQIECTHLNRESWTIGGPDIVDNRGPYGLFEAEPSAILGDRKTGARGCGIQSETGAPVCFNYPTRVIEKLEAYKACPP